jgi:hypothetical protein
MEPDALFYTFSTICQTLAGAFGFLLAIALYQKNNLVASMRDLWLELKLIGNMPIKELTKCANYDDWEGMARLLRDWKDRANPGRMGPPFDMTQARATRFIECSDANKNIRVYSSLSLWLTVITIMASLISLPFTHHLASSPWGGVVLIAVIGFAFLSLLSYVPLIGGIVSSPAVRTPFT